MAFIPREQFVSGILQALTTNTVTDVIAAPGAGLSVDITDILVTNAHAATSTKVRIYCGATVMWNGFAKADGGGFVQDFGVPLVGTDNGAWRAESVTTGSDIQVNLIGYKRRS